MEAKAEPLVAGAVSAEPRGACAGSATAPVLPEVRAFTHEVFARPEKGLAPMGVASVVPGRQSTDECH